MTDDDQEGLSVSRSEPCARCRKAARWRSICSNTQHLSHCLLFVFAEEIKVSVNDFIIKAAAVTLRVSIVTV